MEAMGLSMSLGAFLAGVLLADSEFRHELEADVEPFKGLLLGLFFMAVGMSANLALFVSHPFAVLGVGVGLMVLKSLVMYGDRARVGDGQRRSAAHRRAARARRRIRLRTIRRSAERGHPFGRRGAIFSCWR